MKVLGVKQFHQMKFKFLPLDGSRFAGTMGKIPKNFIAVIYGHSGNGKTEFCMQLAKELCRFGKVGWLGYEQRHGSDLQEATKRNRMQEVSGDFYPIDPISNVPEGVSLLEDLDRYLRKRNSPDFIFVDSVDYTGFTWADYVYLKTRYGQRKGLVFIAHSSKAGRLKKEIASKILFDGGLGIHVSNYIAHPEKNRFGGFEPYVVWEERARLLNPAYFSKQVTSTSSATSKEVKNKTTPEKVGATVKNGSDPSTKLRDQGVRAKKSIKTQG